MTDSESSGFRSRPGRWLVRGALILAAACLLVSFVGVGLVSTEVGARWTFRALGRAGLEVDAVRGRLSGPLVLEGVHVRTTWGSATVRNVRIEWRPGSLFRRHLEFSSVRIEGLRVVGAPPSREEERALVPPSLAFPVALTMEELVLLDGRVHSPGGREDLRLPRVVFAGSVVDRVLRVDSLEIVALRSDGERLNANVRGRYDGRPPHSLSLETGWDATLSEGRTLEGAGEAFGDLANLRIRHRLTFPAAVDLDASVRNPLSGPTWRATVVSRDTPLEHLAANAPPGRASVTALASGTDSTATVVVEGAADLDELDRIDLRAELTADRDTLRLDSLRVGFAHGHGTVRARGRIDLATDVRRGRFAAEWSDLQWPLSGDGGGSETPGSPAGTLTVEGSPRSFRASLTARAAGGPLPPSRIQVDAEGGVEEAYRLQGAMSGEIEGGERLAATFDLQGGDDRYVLRSLRASVPGSDARLELTGELLRGDTTRANLEGSWSQIRYPFRGDSAWTSPRGRFRLSATPTDFRGRVDGTATGPGMPTADWSADAEGEIREDTVRTDFDVQTRVDGWPEIDGRGTLVRTPEGLRLAPLLLRVPETGARVEVSAERAEPTEGQGTLRARAAWTDLAWPPSPTPVVASQTGDARFSMVDSQLRLDIRSDLSGPRLPPAFVEAAVSGTTRSLLLDSLRVRTLGGEITGRGTAVRDSVLRWGLHLSGRDLDPDDVAAGWDGRLDVDLEARGTMGPDTLRGHLTVHEVDGLLRDRAFFGRLDARVDGNRVVVDTLAVMSGASRLDASGAVGEHWDLRWRLDAEELSDFHPAVTGRMRSEGRIHGPSGDFRVSASAVGRELGMGESRVERLDLDADVDLGGTSPSSLRMDMESVAVASAVLDSLRVSASGRPGDHAVALDVFLDPDRLTLRAGGGAQGSGWVGSLHRLELESPRAGSWSLEEPTTAHISPDSAFLGDLCWVGSGGRACAGGTWSRIDGVAWSAMARDIPVGAFAALMPPTLEADGHLNLETRGRIPPEGPPSGEASVRVEDGHLRHRLSDGRLMERSIEAFEIDAAGSEQGELTGRIAIRIPGLASLDGSLLTSMTGVPGDRPLAGRLSLRVTDGGLLGSVLPGVSETGGEISATAEADGNWETPLLAGSFELRDGRATVVPAGIRVSDLRFDLRPGEDPGRWLFEASAQSGEGLLDVSGDLTLPWASEGLRIDSRIVGERFEVYRTHLGHVLASPDLRVEGSPDRVDVSGQIRLPRARLTAQRLEASTPTSLDVVFADSVVVSEDDVRRVAPPNLSARVTLILGDDVGLDALGIRGELEGTLLISAAPGRQPVASGELNVVRGSYTAYRQTLQIERGRLLYANSPLDDPGLDLRITRRSQDVLAGMNVGGTARNPAVSFFSEPPLDDQEILAYLVAGRPLSALDQGEGRLVESLARSVGISGGNLVLARLGMMFGLETARIERGSGGEGANVVLGRRLLPRLEVNYAVGLLGAANAVRLRYDLGRGWYLQSESGRETGADVVYVVQ